MATIQFDIPDAIIDRVITMVPKRYGWVESTTNDKGETVPNPVSAKEFFFNWLPDFLAAEVYARELYEAQQAAAAQVEKITLANATEKPK